MHATLKLNKFHSPAFAGQSDIQFQRLQWLYPQKKFLLRSTSRYTYVLCIVSKCWCSCERGILVWREPSKKWGTFGYIYNYVFTSGAYHIRMMHASIRGTNQAQNFCIGFRLTYCAYKRISFWNYFLLCNFATKIIYLTIEYKKKKEKITMN